MPENTAAYSKRRECFRAYAPFIIWIAVILILGSGAGASAQTSRIIKPLIEFFFPSAPPETFLLIHGVIRKAAHFVEYAVLAILAARALTISPSDAFRGKWPIRVLLVVLGVAAVDELVQSFNVTRTGSPWDVAIDLAGGCVGLLIFAGFNRLRVQRVARE